MLFVVFTEPAHAHCGSSLFATVYQQIETYLFTPRISKRTMDVNPGIALAAVFIGAAIWGPIGALIGIPLAAAVVAVVGTYGHRYELVPQLEAPELEDEDDDPAEDDASTTPPTTSPGPGADSGMRGADPTDSDPPPPEDEPKVPSDDGSPTAQAPVELRSAPRICRWAQADCPRGHLRYPVGRLTALQGTALTSAWSSASGIRAAGARGPVAGSGLADAWTPSWCCPPGTSRGARAGAATPSRGVATYARLGSAQRAAAVGG